MAIADDALACIDALRWGKDALKDALADHSAGITDVDAQLPEKGPVGSPSAADARTWPAQTARTHVTTAARGS